MNGNGDPRLTAFALGECDPAERAEVEALIARDPEARAEVEAVRAAAGAVEAALAGAAVPVLEAGRRAAVEGALAKHENPVPIPAAAAAAPAVPARKPRAVRPLVGAAAAMALLGMGFGVAGYTVAVGRVEVAGTLPNYSGVFLDEDLFASNFGQGTKHRQVGGTNFEGFRIGKGGREIIDGTLAHNGVAEGVDRFGGVTILRKAREIEDLRRQLSDANAMQLTMEERELAATGNLSTATFGFSGGGGGGGHQYSGNIDGGGTIAIGSTPDGKPGYYYYGGAGGGGAGGAVALYAGAKLDTRQFEALKMDPSVKVRVFGTLPQGLPSLNSAHIGSDFKLQPSGGAGFALPNEVAGTTVGAVVNQADGTVQLFDVRDITRGIPDFPAEDSTTETFAPLPENPWIRPVGEAALSTFSVDVDTAAYSIVRRCLTQQNRLPPPGAVRIEELVNYFPYEYAAPSGPDPFAVLVEAASCPWEPRHRLVRVALKGRVVDDAVRPAANLVFLIDVSGSMGQPNKLPLVQESMKLLLGRLDARDRVAIVVYAGASGLVLPSTRGNDPSTIINAIGNLSSGGSTNGGAGIELAYRVATENFIPGGINRVILATDGDFNVGIADQSSLVSLIEEKAKSKVFLTALGFGMDNLKDSTLEQLADKGNGNYGYVDDLAETRKILVEQGMSTLHTIAKDVKIQVEFNPAKVAGYRLLGYENRVLAAQDFTDDRKDAGEVGAGHAVTAFYEVVPAGQEVPGAAVDELRYQRPGSWNGSLDTLTVKLRWKEPEGDVSTPREIPFTDAEGAFDRASEEFRFAAAVVQWGLLLRGSKNAGSASFAGVQEIASGAMGGDEGGWKAEFLRLVALSAGMQR